MGIDVGSLIAIIAGSLFSGGIIQTLITKFFNRRSDSVSLQGASHKMYQETINALTEKAKTDSDELIKFQKKFQEVVLCKIDLIQENADLRVERDRYKRELDTLRKDFGELRGEVSKLRSRIKELEGDSK